MKRLLFVLALFVVAIGVLGWYREWFHIGSDNADGKSNVTLSVDKDKIQEDRKAALANVEEVGHQAKDRVAGPSEKPMDGTLVSVIGDKLTMNDREGKEHSHALAADIKVTCDGKACTAADLKTGMKIRVTAKDDAPRTATRIDALNKNAAFEKAG